MIKNDKVVGVIMAEIKQIVQLLKQALNIRVTSRLISDEEVSKSEKVDRNGTLYFYHKAEDQIWIPLEAEQTNQVLAFRAEDLTDSEIILIQLWLHSVRSKESSMNPRTGSKQEDERQLRKLGEWIVHSLQAGQLEAELPEDIGMSDGLTKDMIPFLLVNESDHVIDIQYKVLSRLLRSYFNGEVTLIPLHEAEWLILAKQELLQSIKDDMDDLLDEKGQERGHENALYSFCVGLHELISTEWVGDFYVSSIPEADALHGLPDAVNLLKQTMHLGRIFQVKEHIHLSGSLHLERLLFHIPQEQRALYLQQYAEGCTELFHDPETLSTLESFFDLDCNVSETAKHLYIHRNTLLYRLDKIKQETGLDVRSFNDAVLVKLTLLLYKLTKRA
ncbi:PucR family transcriptional regulator [Paenibacillus sp. JSM ZJ436]|uniref:PucR family transcriptional regulator n=1 Tax=Paenibacillus sp. JSM ZJ436 TaxID=3376190 RepID=UPI0037A6B9A8